MVNKFSGWVVVPLLLSIPVLILFGVFNSLEKEYFLGFYPRVPKEFSYMDKKFYIEYSESCDEYILYRRNRFSLERMAKFSSRYRDSVFKEVKKYIDEEYQGYLVTKSKKDLVINWDGYLTTMDKRDDKIGKILY